MTFSKICWIPSLALGLLAVSCAPSGPVRSVPRAEQVLYQWHDDGGPGEVAIQINLSEQKAYFRRGSRDIGWSYVATGKEGHMTVPGKFSITEKIVDKHSGSYGWIEDEYGNTVNGDATPRSKVGPGQKYMPAPMPYWMRLTSYGVGMHGGKIPQPGEPASHGCIRMPYDLVPQLYDVVHVGTPVRIIN